MQNAKFTFLRGNIMKEKIEELINKKIEKLLQEEDLSLEELTFLATQIDRLEAKKMQENLKNIW